jgi:cytochrome b involved in lipid metabolism
MTYGKCVDAGKDATQDFEEIGHSKSARDMLDKYLIGAYAVSSCQYGHMTACADYQPLGGSCTG